MKSTLTTILCLSALLMVSCDNDKKKGGDDPELQLRISNTQKYGELCGVQVETSCIAKILQIQNPIVCGSSDDMLQMVNEYCD